MQEDYKNNFVIIRGAGDLASGIAKTLFDVGYKVILLEIEKPSVIRRTVAFADAVYNGMAAVEDTTAKFCNLDVDEINDVLKEGFIPLVIDPNLKILELTEADILIDAIIVKKNLGTKIDMADVVIGVGPGFRAKIDVDAVIETSRGHALARTIFDGEAKKNTGIPGNIAGYTKERVIHAENEGSIKNIKKISDIVKKGEILAYIDDVPVRATIDGVLRGIIKDGYYCHKGLKIADIDPRISEKNNCFTISDKSRAIANAVLYTILVLKRRNK